MSCIQKSNSRKRVRLIGVRLTPHEFLMINSACEAINSEIIKAAKENGTKPSKRAMYTAQRYLVDAALHKPPSPVIVRPAPVEIAQLAKLVIALERNGGLTKAFITGTGDHFSKRDLHMTNVLETKIEPTADEKLSGSLLIAEMRLLVDETKKVLKVLKDKMDGETS